MKTCGSFLFLSLLMFPVKNSRTEIVYVLDGEGEKKLKSQHGLQTLAFGGTDSLLNLSFTRNLVY